MRRILILVATCLALVLAARTAALAETPTGGAGTAGSGTIDPGTTRSGTIDPGTTRSGTAGSGTPDSGTAISGTASTGTTVSGTKGSGTTAAPTIQEPVVRQGREDGAPYGSVFPANVASHAKDDPEAREEWFFRQRAYPFDSFPASAYGDAALEYVRAREAVRKRHLVLESALAEGAPSGRGSAFEPEALPTGPWIEVGPSPIFDDGSGSGLFFGNVAGRISAVAVHPTNPYILLVGGSRGGIWRSTDNGFTWAPVADDQTTLVIADIEFAPSNPDIVYAATGDDDKSFWGAGMLKSSDAGAHWIRVDNGTTGSGIPNGTVLSKLAVDPTDPQKVVAAGFILRDSATGSGLDSYIYRTTNGGATWSKATIPSAPNNDNLSRFRSLVIEPNCPTHLWAVDFSRHTIIRSTDGGATWTTVAASGLPSFTANTKITAYHASCSGSATLYASVQSGSGLAGSSGYRGVYRSTNDGATWSLPGAQAGPAGGCLAQCGYDHELLVDPTDPSLLYMLGRDIWTSADSGASWANRSAGFDNANNYYGGWMHVDLHDVALRGSGPGATVYVAGDGGLWSYDTAFNTFTNRNGNLAISEFTDLAVNPEMPNRALGGLQDNGSIHYIGYPAWTARLSGDGGDGGWLRSTPGAGNPIDGAFTTYIGNFGYKSTDAGESWSNYGVWASDTTFNETAEFYAPWVATLGDNRVWHGAASLWYTNFPNGSWVKKANNLADMTGSFYISKIAIHNPSPGVIGPYYVANFPRAFLQSADGTTWNNRTGTLPDRYISDIEFNPANPQQVWVTLQGFGTGHVWYSPDGGVSWQNKSGNLPNVPANDILIDPLNAATTWFVGLDIGVYATSDGGATWAVVGSNLPALCVSDLDLGPGRNLFAATAGRSAWRITLPGAVPPPGEVSASPPLLLAKAGGSDIEMSWQDLHLSPQSYNIYEGEIGTWYSHVSVNCALAPPDITCSADRCQYTKTFGPYNQYYLVTASGPGGEGPAGSPATSWTGPDHVTSPVYVVPTPCGSP